MHEAAPVHVGERAAELDADVGDEGRGQGPARGPLVGDDGREVRPRDVLHGDEVLVPDAAEVEDGDEVAVRQRHLRARLLEEHAQEAPVVRELGQHALDDQALLEPFGADVAREEDLGHAATRPSGRSELVAHRNARSRSSMIHFASMRATLCVLTVLVARPGLAAAAAPPPTGAPSVAVAVYWQPVGHPPLGAEARAAFVSAMGRQGARLVDATSSEAPAPALAARLASAEASYARFAFPEAIAALDDLQRLVDALGGADLDARQLSELFLYRGLARLETAGAGAAWDDLVRAARLDPGRALDPAQFPPGAVSAFKRAVEEATAAPRVALVVEAPDGAVVRVDGQSAPAGTPVALGPHLVSVAAAGYERWAGVVSVASARERFVPPLRAQRPPDGDRLLGLAGEPAPRRLILGALVVAPAGWRFAVSEVVLPEGQVVADAVALGAVPTRYAVEALVARVAPGPRAATPLNRRWSTWVITGGAVLLLSLGTTWLLTRDATSPNVTGSVGSLKQ